MSKAFDLIVEERKKLVNEVIKNLEKGELFSRKSWNPEILRPENPSSKAVYSGINKTKLMFEAIKNEYKDPRWVTYKQAEKEGWKIKKGAKSVLCEKWIIEKEVKEKDKNGKEINKTIKLDKPIPHYFRVFNAEQVEGIPPLELKTNYKPDIEITDDILKSSEVSIKELAQGKAFYNSQKDEIILPLRESFRSNQDFLAVALHEMAHSTGHESRLNRDLSGKFGSESYAKEELTAELSSLFLQGKLGIEVGKREIEKHSAYIDSWIKVLKKDYNELFRAANAAEKASDRIYERYLEHEKEQLLELAKSAEKIKVHPLDSFSVHFHYAETGENTKGLNFEEEEKKYRGIKAYEFIEKVIKFDKEHSAKMEVDDNVGYYKSWVTINLKGYTTEKIRIDLGDKEFGGYEKVSDALEHRLKSFPNELIKYKKEYAESYGVTPETIEKDAEKILEKIDKSMSHFREKEKTYLNERELSNEKLVENKKVEVNLVEKVTSKISKKKKIKEENER